MLNEKDTAQVKRELVRILRDEPRAEWVQAIMDKYGCAPAHRVAVFQIFCAMEQNGELDELKAAKPSPSHHPAVRKAAWGRIKRPSRATIAAILGLALMISTASADDHRRESRRENHNYILERQSIGAVGSGEQPTIRRIVGRRELDIYRDGSMYEKNNYVGHAH